MRPTFVRSGGMPGREFSCFISPSTLSESISIAKTFVSRNPRIQPHFMLNNLTRVESVVGRPSGHEAEAC